MKRDIKSLNQDELVQQFAEWNEPAYRAGQLLNWLYERRALAFDEMSNLPASLRARLSEAFDLKALDLVTVRGASDTTRKFLWRLSDGALIESVLIPASPALYGERSDRHTLCVSTQVGCAYGCRFCASGLEGWKRNLRPEEIVEQVLSIERWHHRELEKEKAGEPEQGRLINNLVIMGMGEPLANYDSLIRALAILNAPWGGNIGARKITVSTSGLAPQIRRLADEPQQYRLALSLHGATDAVREKIMPINHKYPIAVLMAACEEFVQKKGQMITFEYILIEGVNDGLDQVPMLAKLSRRLKAKVNLIPYNQVEGLSWNRPSTQVQERFAAALERLRVPVTLRREKGHEIDAACGQLRLQHEQQERLQTRKGGDRFGG